MKLNLRYPGLFYFTLSLSLVLLSPYLFLALKGLTGSSLEWNHISSHLLGSYIWDTTSILLSVGSFSLIFGVLPAFLISRFEFKGSRFFSWALVGPLAIPTFIMSICYSGITDITGPMAGISRTLFGQAIYFDILNFWGLSITLSFALYPYVFLSSLLAFKNRTSAYEEAASSLGLNRTQVFRRITLPLSLPFILSGLLLVLMEVLNNYGAMKYYGQNTLTTGVFKAWFDLNDLNSAIYIGAILFGFTIILLFIRQKSQLDLKKTSIQKVRKIPLKGLKAFSASLICALLFTCSFLIPALYIFNNGIKYFEKIVDKGFVTLLFSTLVLCILSALVILLLSLLFSESKRWLKNKTISRLLEMNNAGYAIPGAIIAIGIIALAQLFEIHSGMIFYSFTLLVFGFAIRFLSSGFQTIDNGLQSKSTGQDESALSLGIGKFKIFKDLHLPQIKLSLAVAFAFVFIEVIKELPLTLILKPFNFESLSTLTFQYAKDEMLEYSCVPAMFILIITIIPNFIIQKSLRS